MDTLHRLDDEAFLAINAFTAHTGWPHPPIELYANYGVALFALLLVFALWRARGSTSRGLGAAGWAALATLIAVGLNQPLVHVAGLLLGVVVVILGWLLLRDPLTAITEWSRRIKPFSALFAPSQGDPASPERNPGAKAA
ncbi:MAG TPA: hypothetical protein VFJ19_17680 [Nocardioidaceae bacterium]|nr:hypothetical protein [Nocardioidaceae bacterium]